jgi:hypothetical protein
MECKYSHYTHEFEQWFKSQENELPEEMKSALKPIFWDCWDVGRHQRIEEMQHLLLQRVPVPQGQSKKQLSNY